MVLRRETENGKGPVGTAGIVFLLDTVAPVASRGESLPDAAKMLAEASQEGYRVEK
jgi:hypothetical protein